MGGFRRFLSKANYENLVFIISVGGLGIGGFIDGVGMGGLVD